MLNEKLQTKSVWKGMTYKKFLDSLRSRRYTKLQSIEMKWLTQIKKGPGMNTIKNEKFEKSNSMWEKRSLIQFSSGVCKRIEIARKSSKQQIELK